MLAERITSTSPDRIELTPFPTHCSELFVVAKEANAFRIKQIHALAPKHPGSVYPKRMFDANRVGTSAPSSIFIPCVFMALQNPFSATRLLSHLYKTGGVRGRPASNQNGKASGRFPIRKMRNLQGGTRLPTASHLSTQPSEATNVFSPRCDRGNR